MSEKLVYIGMVVNVEPIAGADFICAATVVCGKGGKWRGVVRKDQLGMGDKCIVYLPDSLIPECEDMRFMERTKWRVKMQRFKGAASEVVIVPLSARCPFGLVGVGEDVTELTGVTKYVKPIPASMAGEAVGDFPGFVRKTDELHWQSVPEEMQKLRGQPYYVTEKVDGASGTAFKWNGVFGVCSRNWELKEGNNGYWNVAKEWGLREKLREGYAVQWETCGPKIQDNPMGLKKVEGYVFSVFDIERQVYLEYGEFVRFCSELGLPMVSIVREGPSFTMDDLTELARGKYFNGAEREGVVVRAKELIQGQIVSFKAINLEYGK